MKNIRLLLAYDGTDFLGWQKTSLGPSIENALELVLRQILQEDVVIQAASRTDAGVHAEGQVVNFFTSKENLSLPKLQKSLNSLLPSSIMVLGIEEMPLNFHPTLDNTGKEYHYFLCNTPYQKPKYRRTSWHVPLPLQGDLIQEAIPFILGEHDFSAFCNTDGLEDKNPLCNIHTLSFTPLGEQRFCFSVTGDRFLFRMVRILAGTLVYIGLKKLPPSEIPNILLHKKRERAGVTAPAHGLHLIQVFYTPYRQVKTIS